MKKLIKMMKPGDLIIVGLLVILSFLPLAIFTYQNQVNAENQLYAVITVDGEVHGKMELKNDHTRELHEVKSANGHVNIVAREGEIVYMREANCPDELCLDQGEISAVGETIVCLPHKVVVEIITQDGDNIDEDSEIDIIS